MQDRIKKEGKLYPLDTSKLERIPPYNIEAEESLLGAMLISRDAIISVIEVVAAEDFYRKSNQEVFNTIKELYVKGEPADPITVADHLKKEGLLDEVGGKTFIHSLISNIPLAANAEYYAQIVRSNSILRKLIYAATEIATMGYEVPEDLYSTVDKAQQLIFSIYKDLNRGSTRDKVSMMKDIVTEAYELVEVLHEAKSDISGIPSGYIDFDHLTSGFQNSDLIVIASRPGMGKTSLVMGMAKHIAMREKLPIAIFSLEMSKQQVALRLMSAESRINLQKLRNGKIKDDEWTQLARAVEKLAECKIYIDDTAFLTVMDLRSRARMMVSTNNIKLIIVDYIQLMQSTTNYRGNKVLEITEISQNLKGIAKELNIPVVAVSQLSREVEKREKKRPLLSDLRESGCLAGNTFITRADTGERIPIKELVGQSNIPVHSLNENWQIEERKISNVFLSGKKMIYELKTKSGFKIKASANHPFRKIEGWYRLDQLAAGDFIAIPRKLSPFSSENELAKEEIILLAHLLGDGCVLLNQPIHYTSADIENIKIVAKTAKKLFSIEPRIVRQKNWWHVYLPSPYRLARGKYHPITNWYKKLGIKRVRSFKKEVPQKIFGLDEKNLCLFLKHLWATDGNLSVRYLKKRKPNAAIYYSTTSEKMAEGIKHLLLRIGIRSKIAEVKKQGYRICYTIRIQGKDDQLRFLQLIGCYGERAKIIPQLIEYLQNIKSNPNVDVIPKEIWQKIAFIKEDYKLSWRGWAENYGRSYSGSSLFKNGVSRSRLAQVLNFMPSLELKNLANSDVFWDEIISISPLQMEEVYDATVPETHNFIANDIIVHNSIEQDADLVAFIYRDDYYEQDESKHTGEAEIMIAKHRNGPTGKLNLRFNKEFALFSNLSKSYQTEDRGE